MDSKEINWSEISQHGYQALSEGNYDRAERYFRLAVESGMLAETDVRLAYSFLILGKCVSHRGDYVGAASLYQRALAIYELAYGPNHEDVAYSLTGVARCRMQCGKFSEARPLYSRALTIYERLRGPEHEDVAHAMENLARCCTYQRDYGYAVPLYERAIGLFKKLYGAEHEHVAATT